MSVDIKELREICSNLNILYAEDEKSVRESTQGILEDLFKNVYVASNGEEALSLFESNKINLVLTDIKMPKLDGLTLIEKIKQIDENIATILISAHNESYYFEKAIDLEVDNYIFKPIILNKFFKSIYKVVNTLKLIEISNNYEKNLELEIAKRNKEIEYKLTNDNLTDLLSRYSFFRDMENIKLPVVLLIDINEFHVINEVYGNDVGSFVLKKFAHELSEMLQDQAYKIYRVSSDEFAVVDDTKFIDTEKYESLIDELFEHLGNLKIKVENHIISIDITIGLSTVESNYYESAKIALDYAKKYKKPFAMYSNQIDHRKERSLTLKCKDDISMAINEQRVVALYQPIVDKDQNVVKHETLMRLKEKESFKLMTPYYFLDVAIKTRLYEQLSTTIIFAALEKLVSSTHILSMNFTYGDIKNNNFLSKIETYIRSNPDIGSRAIFEITESESIENYDDVKAFIHRFRKYGVKIAIDDFGSGFSNFEYILEIEPDYLKIDGSLIKDIDTNAKSLTLVEAIVQFSHQLGITVIAEYVHSQKIFEMLKKLGVDEYQGYYFSEPLEKI